MVNYLLGLNVLHLRQKSRLAIWCTLNFFFIDCTPFVDRPSLGTLCVHRLILGVGLCHKSDLSPSLVWKLKIILNQRPNY